MNSVILIGRLARDPELSYTPSQMAICHFTLAVDRPRKRGEERGADFIRITVFDRQAENCGNYLAKGRQAAVKGRIQTGSYKGRDGKMVYTTDVIADNVEFIGSQGEISASEGRNDAGRTSYPQAQNKEPQGQISGWDMPDSFASAEDDIPF